MFVLYFLLFSLRGGIRFGLSSDLFFFDLFDHLSSFLSLLNDHLAHALQQGFLLCLRRIIGLGLLARGLLDLLRHALLLLEQTLLLLLVLEHQILLLLLLLLLHRLLGCGLVGLLMPELIFLLLFFLQLFSDLLSLLFGQCIGFPIQNERKRVTSHYKTFLTFYILNL